MWTDWLIALVVTLLLGLAATFYLRKIRLPQQERAAGIASLTDLRWRAFVKIALEALAKRGYSVVGDAGSDGDYLLARDGGKWLLSTRHGGSSRVDSHALAELAKDIRMRGANGGLVVSPGTFAPGIVRQAKLQNIELLDGPTLWSELRPLLAEGQYDTAAVPARIKTRQHTLLAWLGALIVGILLAWMLSWMLGPADNASSATPQVMARKPPAIPAATTTASASAMPVTAGTQDATPNHAQAVDVDTSPAPTDTAKLIQRRRQVIQLISTLPQVDRAIWSTQSTLLVYLLDDKSDPVPELCQILEHFEELRTSRLQLQPPHGSSKLVRFLQCRNN